MEQTNTVKASLFDLLDNYRKKIFKENPEESPKEENTILRSNISGPEEYEKAWQEYLKINPEASQYKDILTRIAKKESSFRNIQNTAGAPAYGYFQLWETNLGGLKPQEVLANPVKQIDLAVNLLQNNRKSLTKEDLEKLSEFGYTPEGADFAMWLGGYGGLKKYLYKGIDSSDSKYYGGKGGSSVGKYIRMAKKGGQFRDIELIELAGKEYYVEIVEDEEDKAIGLSNRDSLPEDEGMLFVINDDEKDSNGKVLFTMEDTKIPLDIIFLDNDFRVTQVSKGKPMSPKPIYGKGDYVLEVNSGSGAKIGDDLEFISDLEVNKKMIVLDPEGKPQMILDGGERIMSIDNTKVLIKFAKKATSSNNDNDYKSLGKRVFKFIEIQDNTPAEYV